MLELDTIIDKLNERIKAFTQTENYKLNIYDKDIVSIITIAINLAAIASRNNNKVREADQIWFKDNYVYLISRAVDSNEWQDIGVLFGELSKIVRVNFF